MNVRGWMVSVVVLAAGLMVGCSSSGLPGGEKGFETFEKTKMGVMNAQSQVDATIQAIEQFQYTGDLNQQFQNYKDAVAALDKQNDTAKWRAEKLQENYNAYLTNWQREMEKVNDPALKSSMESRKAAVQSNLDQVKASAQVARDAFHSFLKDNQDIRAALSVNLSRGTVDALQPQMKQAIADGQTLKQKLGAIQDELANIESGVPASGATPPAK